MAGILLNDVSVRKLAAQVNAQQALSYAPSGGLLYADGLFWQPMVSVATVPTETYQVITAFTSTDFQAQLSAVTSLALGEMLEVNGQFVQAYGSGAGSAGGGGGGGGGADPDVYTVLEVSGNKVPVVVSANLGIHRFTDGGAGANVVLQGYSSAIMGSVTFTTGGAVSLDLPNGNSIISGDATNGITLNAPGSGASALLSLQGTVATWGNFSYQWVTSNTDMRCNINGTTLIRLTPSAVTLGASGGMGRLALGANNVTLSTTQNLTFIETGNDASTTILFGATSTASITPRVTNATDLGSSALVWRNLYVTNAPVVGSDSRLKTEVSAIPDALLDAFDEVEYKRYKMPGTGDNLWRVGIIAQDFVAACERHGVDPMEYIFVRQAEPVESEDGETQPGMYALAYTDLAILEAASVRRKLAK